MKLNIALLLMTLVFCFSCASEKPLQDDSYRILEEFANDAARDVEFDPYTAKFHFDRSVIQKKFEVMNQKLINNGCGRAVPLTNGIPDEEHFIKFELKNFVIQNDAWKSQLYQQLAKERQGWAIVQVEYPKSGLQHGDFSVRGVVALYIAWCGGSALGGEYGLLPAFYINVKSRALTETSKSPEESAAKF